MFYDGYRKPELQDIGDKRPHPLRSATFCITVNLGHHLDSVQLILNDKLRGVGRPHFVLKFTITLSSTKEHFDVKLENRVTRLLYPSLVPLSGNASEKE